MLLRCARVTLRDTRVRHLSWTFLDQSVVSAGAFIVQVTLARRLLAVDYGVFALVFGGLLTLQLCNATLLFHPMSVRVPAATGAQRRSLMGASLILVTLLSVAEGVLLAIVLAALGRLDLVFPALAFFMTWQLQEGLRRGLLGSFLHSAAIAGDAVMYIGQALMVIGLGFTGSLSVSSALYAMAVSAVLSAIVHSWQLELAPPTRSSFRAVLADFWSIGGTASLGNGYLALGRIMVVPWALAAISGPAAAAGYQAAANIVNLSNPLVLGLGNIIPQAAASASAGGNAHAWRAVRSYVLITLPPIALYSVVILAVPGESLRIFYGAASDYTHVTSAVRLLILVALAGFAIEAVIAFLHGITSVRRAATINIAGSATSAIIVLPLVSLFGLNGGCITLLLANAVRLVLTRRALALVTAPQLRSSDVAVVYPAAQARPAPPH